MLKGKELIFMILAQTNKTYITILRIVSLLCVIVGLITAVKLYSSFGSSPSEKLIYATIGCLLAVGTPLFLSGAYFLFSISRIMLAIACGFIGLALFAFGVLSHLGFFSVAQTEMQQKSKVSQLLKENAESSIKTLKGSNIDTNEFDKKTAEIDKNIQVLQLEKEDYKKRGMISKGVNLVEAKIAVLEKQKAEFETLKKSSGNQNNALLAIEKYQSAIDINSNENAHPLFKQLAILTSYSASEIRATILLCTAFIFELLGTVGFIAANVIEVNIFDEKKQLAH